jgi:DNA-directed RNA polymerase subunit omega
MIIDIPDEYDSKFRFILVAAERAKQLQNGYPPMIDEKSPKPAHIAIQEAQQGLITWEILEEADEDAVEAEFDGSEEY